MHFKTQTHINKAPKNLLSAGINFNDTAATFFVFDILPILRQI